MVRRSKVLVETPSRQEAEQLMNEYAFSAGMSKKLKAEMELKIQAIRQRYQAKMKPHQEIEKSHFEKIQAYAIEHKDTEFHKKKSQDWGVGLLGFRINPPKVKARKGYTLKSALELIVQRGLMFTKQKVEIDKEKIIQSREDEEVMKEIHNCGLELVQEEGFYIDVKEESDVVSAY